MKRIYLSIFLIFLVLFVMTQSKSKGLELETSNLNIEANLIQEEIQILQTSVEDKERDAKALEKKEPTLPVFATWYGESPEECLGCSASLIMANGERYDETKYTAAANFVPLGTFLLVSYRGAEIIVEVTDRMLYDDRIDLSKRAFEDLAFLETGLIQVNIRK